MMQMRLIRNYRLMAITLGVICLLWVSSIDAVSPKRCDITIEAPGETKPTGQYVYWGVQDFDNLPTSKNVVANGWYGGAGTTGKYHYTKKDVELTAQVPGGRGLNHFYVYLTAIDRQNKVTVYNGAKEICSITGRQLIDEVPRFGDYWGNPAYNPKKNQKQLYVGVNFYTFKENITRAVLSTSWYYAMESDHHQFSWFDNWSGEVVHSVDLP